MKHTTNQAETGEGNAPRERWNKREVKKLLHDLQFEYLEAADHFQKLFYNSHGVISPDACYAKEQTYRHCASVISKKINSL